MSALLHYADLLRDLGTHLGLMGLLVLAYALLEPARLPPRGWSWRHAALGLAFGLVAILVQLAPLLLAEGVRSDARGVLLALAGAYLPPPSALLALGLAGAYRLMQGGPLAGQALLGMVLALALGWAWARAWPRCAGVGRVRWRRALWLAGLGVAVALAGALMLWLLLPGELGPRLAAATLLPVLLAFVAGCLGLGTLLDLVLDHGRDLQALQQALHERELGQAQLELALEASGAAPWEWDLDARQMRLSERFFRQLDYAPGAFPATLEQWRAMLHPDDVEQALRMATEAARSAEGSYVNEYRMRDARGQWRWLLSRGRVVRRGPRGEPQLMIGSHLDIDTLRRQQAAVLASQERFQKIYQTTPDAMGISRLEDGIYLDVNEAFVRLSGYSREEALGRRSVDLGLWADPAQRELMVQQFRRDGRLDSMEIALRRKDGQLLHGLLSVRALPEQGEDCLLFIYRDITERRRLREAAEAAAAANLAKTEFLSRMSHELRTPLNAVLGFAQLLLAVPEPVLRERQRAQVEAIAQAGWHLLELINDMLDISRIEAGQLQLQPQPVALAPLLDEALELLGGPLREMEIRPALRLAPALPLLAADPVRLRQALVNLLSNAVKYNRRGGALVIEAAPAEPGWLALEIRDGGLGMDEQQLAHLFEPFNRLGRERGPIEGTGIGLVLTRYLLELMGAGLALRSVAGAGTTVTLRLPLHAGDGDAPQVEDPARAAAAAPAAPAAMAGLRLLYVEDNAVNRLLVQEMLAGWGGLSLSLAEDGAEGLRQAAALRPDLILLDMRLPDMDGLELLSRLRAEPGCAALRVIALSASAMPDEVERTLAAGAEEYWTKPLQLQRFRADLERVFLSPPAG
ncbi:PAS domain S-box protein [Roseateles sp. DAIF2]|uniref:PAS domain S-box protein n=1 Tax=Roseateles sp. DAIF2 TaxID=2714952 RepID=UPI0018A2D614|nr:PAS domain S-box protein [Roseateles sp. DAIF2]QPF75444.1 PAS domain S-box protein [Roseateles sp. DAIF2]